MSFCIIDLMKALTKKIAGGFSVKPERFVGGKTHRLHEGLISERGFILHYIALEGV